jgi:hypothetical protein
MAEAIRESRWNVKHECDTNHGKKVLDYYGQELLKKEPQFLYAIRKRSPDWCNHVVYQPIPRDKKGEM